MASQPRMSLTLSHPIFFKTSMTPNAHGSQHYRIACLLVTFAKWVASPNIAYAFAVTIVRVVVQIEYYMRRLSCRCYNHVTYNQTPFHSVAIHACHHEGIMTPLMGITVAFWIAPPTNLNFSVHKGFRHVLYSNGFLHGFVLYKMKTQQQ